MKQRFYTVAEAAEQKGLSRAAIYDAIGKKRLPRRYSRGNLVVSEAALEAWEQSKKKRGRPKGKAISEEHKARIAEALKQRWQQRKEASGKAGSGKESVGQAK